MDDPKLSPFTLTRSRIVLLILGAVLVLIAISTAMGGLGSYQALKDASNAAKEAAAEQTQ
jgi:flagellar basal body-associated protein FliL